MICVFQEEEIVNYPARGSGVLGVVLFVYKALVEIDDDALIALADVTPAHAKPLIFLVSISVLQGFVSWKIPGNW